MNDEILRLLQLYFPTSSYSEEELTQKIEKGEILTREEDILPYLQTALLDEKVLEVELDRNPHLYFSRLQDNSPVPVDDKGQPINPEPEKEDEETEGKLIYYPGDYLYSFDHIMALPLEPGLGSLRLRQSTSVVLRMFTQDYGIEMGTTFRDTKRVHGLPVLQLAYPSIICINKNSREFRAKVPDHQDFIVEVERDAPPLELTTSAIDVSRKGMGISIDKYVHRQLQLEEELTLKLYIDDELRARVTSKVRHLSKVRKRMGIEYCCGVEFELTSRTITSVMESIVAATQRAHLKQLAEIAASRDIDLLP